jgi:hypothetical protein
MCLTNCFHGTLLFAVSALKERVALVTKRSPVFPSTPTGETVTRADTCESQTIDQWKQAPSRASILLCCMNSGQDRHCCLTNCLRVAVNLLASNCQRPWGRVHFRAQKVCDCALLSSLIVASTPVAARWPMLTHVNALPHRKPGMKDVSLAARAARPERPNIAITRRAPIS